MLTDIFSLTLISATSKIGVFAGKYVGLNVIGWYSSRANSIIYYFFEIFTFKSSKN